MLEQLQQIMEILALLPDTRVYFLRTAPTDWV
jgi:hypothetical protein